ncbi:hypothetical protein GCM10027598_69970 [Amycolatopsis oliviviridis]|uniref:Uncharacterized protein n=1 Tax=Amycolatopsis oliviviridis TaxID=1471590 RepID=A0ABQ3LY91_9PSEU|nr:hypothetical protein [Amycolatopsis oliviviridis]GHH29114.1 hypothetical protein GCM10017790_60730 [Amycolatopsis oliviviridis]
MRTMGKTLGITAAVVLIAACDPAPPAETAVHTDPAPVAETFPEVGEIVETSWVEEKMGAAEGRVAAPGPTDYRLSAVVKLRREAAAKVLDEHKCQAGSPAVPEPLKGLVPSGVKWLSCELPANGKARTAFVADGTEQGILTSTTM